LLEKLEATDPETRIAENIFGEPKARFMTWIDPRFQAAAIARTKEVHPKGVETISKEDVEGLPDDTE
jgi:hypothetical protein